MRAWIVAGALMALAGIAQAEVVESGAEGFTVRHTTMVEKLPEAIWPDLEKIGEWWSDAHTYSGRASNMTLSAQAGGCFCERWDGGSVEHGRVVAVMRNQLLRLHAALGPLQDMGVNGVLSIELAPANGAARSAVTMTYKVTGPASANLAQIAPVVDSVLGEQFARLAQFANTGRAE